MILRCYYRTPFNLRPKNAEKQSSSFRTSCRMYVRGPWKWKREVSFFILSAFLSPGNPFQESRDFSEYSGFLSLIMSHGAFNFFSPGVHLLGAIRAAQLNVTLQNKFLVWLPAHCQGCPAYVSSSTGFFEISKKIVFFCA